MVHPAENVADAVAEQVSAESKEGSLTLNVESV
ncbi:hypothetical protein FF38_13695 [Lucilia cuprina]|uniref:Uncharacterized protein n=1 Tax=Lucilia cuprina TaxID=7375 RepID=A0A0L0BW28_LUCCU|nr:hypothetical protein FF38_13695 [Lucilia cuprina]